MSNTNVSLTSSDAVSILNTIGDLVSAVDPKAAGAVAAITGAVTLINDTIVPAISHLGENVITIAEQASLAAESALERAQVGAPPAEDN